MAARALTIIPTPDLQDPIQASAVRAALAELLAHDLFKDTTRMQRFLVYIVEEALAGRADRLKGYSIGLEVFDRPENFDPQADTIVRVQAGQLRRRLDLYYANADIQNDVRILMPKGGYAPVFEFRNAPDALEDRAQVAPAPISANDPRPSIAVLTLDNLTGPGEGCYFSAGLSAEIVNALVQFRGLRVVTLTPRVGSRVNNISTQETGRMAGADFVLSGNVRRDGSVFRVTLNLIRAETGEHIFSRVSDRAYEPGGVFSLQEEIASYTAAAIAAPFGAVNRYNRRTPSRDPNSRETLDATLKYHDLRLSPTRSGAEELLETFKSLTVSEMQFSTGWAMRGLLNTFLVSQTLPIPEPRPYLEDAEYSGKTSVKIDPQNALGHFSLYMGSYLKGDLDEADEHIREALSLNPNDYWMLAYYAVGLAMRGQTAASLRMQKASEQLVGHAPNWFRLPTLIQAFLEDQYEDVISTLNVQDTRAPFISQLMTLSSYGWSGQTEVAGSLLAAMRADIKDLGPQTRKAITLWQMHKGLSDKLISGLAQAGLDIAPLP